MRVTSGALSASGKSAIAFPDEGLPELSAEFDGSLQQFQLDWAEPQKPLLSWSDVALSGANITTRPISVEISQIKLIQPSMHVERQADGQDPPAAAQGPQGGI